MIGDDIQVCVVDIRGDKVRLGFTAPNNVDIHRREVWLSIKNLVAPRGEIRVPEAASGAAEYPAGWPACPGCGQPALDGHITCGNVACDEGGRRP
jgi:hypothetical protein